MYDAIDAYEDFREATFSDLAADEPVFSPFTGSSAVTSLRGAEGKADRAPIPAWAMTIAERVAAIPARIRATRTRREMIDEIAEVAR